MHNDSPRQALGTSCPPGAGCNASETRKLESCATTRALVEGTNRDYDNRQLVFNQTRGAEISKLRNSFVVLLSDVRNAIMNTVPRFCAALVCLRKSLGNAFLSCPDLEGDN